MQTIKDYLKQSGYTQERMANKLGVSVMAVNSLLTGRRKFGVKTATAWAKAFGFNPLYLMTGEGEMLATEQPAPADAVPVYDVDFLAGFGELYDPDTDKPKRSLSVPQLRELATAELPPRQAEALDVFVLSFLLAGINPADLYDLRATHGGRVQYTRKKTGKLYDLPVVDSAAALIERHRGVSRLLATCERYSSARHFTAFCNGQLQRINLPALHGITLTMYWARHTWATVAAGLDTPTDTIAAALGHGSHTVTDIYIRRDAAKVDEALRQVAGVLV